jgi:fluoride ion exporter CrcB/FEX
MCPPIEEYRVPLLVGVFGSNTTFSSFEREMLALAHDGEWFRAAA